MTEPSGKDLLPPVAATIRRALDPRPLGRFLRYALRRFQVDGCLRAAASLSYATLLSLVPLIAIALAVLSAFPVFDSARDQIQALILRNFLPETSAAVSDKLAEFVQNARQMTAPGVLALAVTTLLLMANINAALNAIWRTQERRPLPARILAYWALMTLGPLLLGASLSLSGYAFAVVQWSGIEAYTSNLIAFSDLVSISLAALGFTMLFHVMPARTVAFRHALTGGVTAAVIFEGLKFGFGLYLENFPTYQAVYGALSTVPIFLVWMYLSWAVVLFGAEVAASLPEWRASLRPDRSLNAGARLALSLALLSRLRAAQATGDLQDERSLAEGLPATPTAFHEVLGCLAAGGLAVRANGDRWLLARDLSKATLEELCRALGLDLAPGRGWPRIAAAAVLGLETAGRGSLERSLEDLLKETPAGAGERLEVIRGEGA